MNTKPSASDPNVFQRHEDRSGQRIGQLEQSVIRKNLDLPDFLAV
jgi:hypothetical protein